MSEVHETTQIAGSGAGVTGGTSGPNGLTLTEGANLPAIPELTFEINSPDNQNGSATVPAPTKNILKSMPPYFVISNPA